MNQLINLEWEKRERNAKTIKLANHLSIKFSDSAINQCNRLAMTQQQKNVDFLPRKNTELKKNKLEQWLGRENKNGFHFTLLFDDMMNLFLKKKEWKLNQADVDIQLHRQR